MAKQKKQSDDISLDFSSVTKLFKKTKIKPGQAVLIGLVLIAMILVFTIRMLPTSLPVTDDWAAQSVNQGIRQQAAQQINQQFPALPQANKDKLINEQVAQFRAANGPQLEATEKQLSEQFKTRMRYTGEDGEEYTYLGDLDSYFWLRYTRNWLETGMACDEVVDGECRDNHMLAPVGVPMDFNPSLHVFVIGWFYKLITPFNPDFPLPATSFLVPVIIGTLGVIPAFFIGRRLAGNVGGFVAAILISLHPLLLSRSIGSDNDVWNVVLPLFTMWMTIEALEAGDNKRRISYGALAGLFIAIHAAVWVGWWFVYLILLFAIIGYLVFRAARYIIRNKTYTVWKDASTKAAGIVFLAFYIGAFIFLLAFTGESPGEYVSKPALVFAASSNLDQAVAGGYWPNVLTTVAELNKSSLGGAIGQMGGKLFFFAGLVGLLFMILPRQIKKWRWEQYGLFLVGAAISVYLLNASGLSKFTVLGLLGLPIAIILILDLVRGYKIDAGVAFVVLVWFAATVYAAYSGVRFILLMIPAFGAAFAVTAGRIYEWLNSYARKEIRWHPYIISIIVFIIIALVLITPVRTGYATASNFVPTIDDAWWDTLTKIREESAPDAVINSWWDFGHWFKYVADRAVSADGTTQHTHVPRWLGKSLVTSDERESIGVLRMLNCGSDAYPNIEGDLGAYGKTNAILQDPIRAQDIVLALTSMDETEAREYLAGEGFTPEQQDDILASTHCPVREDYYITSGDMTSKAGVWAHFGLWDFERAYVVQESTKMARGEAVADLTERFGWTEKQAESLYFEAKGLVTEQQKNAFVSPWPGYITQNWVGGCRTQSDNSTVVCGLSIGISRQGNSVTAVDSFIYNGTDPNSSRLSFGVFQNNAKLGGELGTPAKLVIADDEGMTEYEFSNPTSPGIAVLFDKEQNRLLMADPALIASVYTQLFFLEGRYNKHFEKFDDRTTITGTRILTWKVVWDE